MNSFIQLTPQRYCDVLVYRLNDFVIFHNKLLMILLEWLSVYYIDF
jgi:hypothetical protein